MVNINYKVKKGDTLYGISKAYGVSVNDLKKINNLNSNSIVVGATLKIPEDSNFINYDNTFTYTVKRGDSLYSIANLYSSSVNDIIKLNNLKSINLNIGDKLLIPEKDKTSLPVNFKVYTVKRGDTIYSIATKNNISVDTLLKDNNKSSNVINVGEVLKIRKEENLECYGYRAYTVKRGDSLYSIAKKFNTTVKDIMDKNNLDDNTLEIGKELVV